MPDTVQGVQRPDRQGMEPVTQVLGEYRLSVLSQI